MERKVGGGIRMGNTCKSMADSFQCMTKPTTIKINKIKKKKKKKKMGLVLETRGSLGVRPCQRQQKTED